MPADESASHADTSDGPRSQACSAGAAACVWAGAGLRVWALPGAGRVRALQLGALTSAPLHAALLALHVTRLRALLPLRWPALGAAAALWSAASLLAGAAGTLLALRAPDYRAAPPALLALLRAAAVRTRPSRPDTMMTIGYATNGIDLPNFQT